VGLLNGYTGKCLLSLHNNPVILLVFFDCSCPWFAQWKPSCTNGMVQ